MDCRTVFILLGLVALAGCKSKSSLVGSWRGTRPGISGGTSGVSVTFNSDGSFKFLGGSAPMTTETDGRYTYDDSKHEITLTVTKMLMGGNEATLTGDLSKPSAPKPVTWHGENQAEIETMAGALTLNRN